MACDFIFMSLPRHDMMCFSKTDMGMHALCGNFFVSKSPFYVAFVPQAQHDAKCEFTFSRPRPSPWRLRASMAPPGRKSKRFRNGDHSAVTDHLSAEVI